MKFSWFYCREITSFVNVAVIHGFPQAVQVFLNQRIYNHLPKLGYTKIRIKTITYRLPRFKYNFAGL